MPVGGEVEGGRWPSPDRASRDRPAARRCRAVRLLDTLSGRRYHVHMETSEYEAPQVIVAGTLESLTQGDASGEYLDQTYPQNTSISSLTFSG